MSESGMGAGTFASGFQEELQSIELGRRGVADVVFDALLDAILSRRIAQGARINDSAFARQLGVSRTPVREALQKMREIGLVEASPYRFTRVAIVETRTLENALAVWEGLNHVLLAEVIDRVPHGILDEMSRESSKYEDAVQRHDSLGAARHNFAFFELLVGLSRNPFVRRGIDEVVYVIRLGGVSLNSWIDTKALRDSHELLIRALDQKDYALAKEAIHGALLVGTQ